VGRRWCSPGSTSRPSARQLRALRSRRRARAAREQLAPGGRGVGNRGALSRPRGRGHVPPRKQLSKRLRRATHFASFPLFALATTHALSAGTDRAALLMRYGAALTTVSVVLLTAARVVGGRRRKPVDLGGMPRLAPLRATAPRPQRAEIEYTVPVAQSPTSSAPDGPRSTGTGLFIPVRNGATDPL